MEKWSDRYDCPLLFNAEASENESKYGLYRGESWDSENCCESENACVKASLARETLFVKEIGTVNEMENSRETLQLQKKFEWSHNGKWAMIRVTGSEKRDTKRNVGCICC
eukprot:Gb_25348 [translate_table: standard]